MKARLIRWAFLLVIGLGIGLGISSTIGYFQAQKEMEGNVITLSPPGDRTGQSPMSRDTEAQHTKTSSNVGGAFALINQDGEDVTQETYANTYKIIFFGFTFCPAVCPTELQKLAVIMDELGSDANQITPIFISVDPERDTPEVMKEYVAQFHPKLVGLTGSQEQIDVVKDLHKVYASKVENDMMDGYMVDHSAFLYFMDKENKMITMYPSKDTAQDIAKDLKTRF
ncbi:MAG: SCO family protein [Alphaproteobacteria bacterium]